LEGFNINQSSMTWTNYVKRYSTVRPPETAEIAGEKRRNEKRTKTPTTSCHGMHKHPN
jgi:hypothetical protein